MRTLKEIIIENVGEDIATPEYLRGLGYDEDTLNDTAWFVGTCWDGDHDVAPVWEPACGGFHISSKMGEMYQEEEPEKLVTQLSVEEILEYEPSLEKEVRRIATNAGMNLSGDKMDDWHCVLEAIVDPSSLEHDLVEYCKEMIDTAEAQRGEDILDYYTLKEE